MRRLTLALSMAGLLVAGTTAAAAQEPSPSPEPSAPPWFGGRVEMPQHGFAVTLPGDWVAFDMGADIETQVEPVISAIGEGWEPDEAGLVQVLTDSIGHYDLMSMDLASIASGDPQQTQACYVGIEVPLEGFTLDDLVPVVVDELTAREGMTVAKGPRALDLPSGLAHVMGVTQSAPGSADVSVALTLYLLARDEESRTVYCLAPSSPADDWLSIIETWEWLPAPE